MHPAYVTMGKSSFFAMNSSTLISVEWRRLKKLPSLGELQYLIARCLLNIAGIIDTSNREFLVDEQAANYEIDAVSSWEYVAFPVRVRVL